MPWGGRTNSELLVYSVLIEPESCPDRREFGERADQYTWKQKTWLEPSALSAYSPGSRLSPTSRRKSLSALKRVSSTRMALGCFFGEKAISRRPFLDSSFYV